MIISQIEPLFNGRSPAMGVKKGEKLANKRNYLHSDNFRIMSTVTKNCLDFPCLLRELGKGDVKGEQKLY